ncbi:MAG: hypothetical protein HQL11_03415 [Candidatus Omnitrophica bacterium]|nr:hypothetical protein [Candidatus Omnitrophota bacterium]
MNSAFLIIIPIFLIIMITFSWRQCIKISLYAVVLEGAVRQWLLPLIGSITGHGLEWQHQYDGIVYLSPFFFLCAAYIKYFWVRSGNFWFFKSRKGRVLFLFSAILAAIAFAEAFNPLLPSLWVGLSGAGYYWFFVPLIYLTGDLFDDIDDFFFFLRTFLYLFAIIGILGIVQYFSPPNHWLNVYGRPSFTAMAGRHVRITGTLTHAMAYSGYLEFVTAILLPALFARQSTTRRFELIGISLLFALNIFMAGSREPIFFLILFVLLYLGIGRPVMIMRAIHRAFVPLVVILILLGSWILYSPNNPVHNFWSSRVTNTRSNTHSRLLLGDYIKELNQCLPYMNVFGYGAGSVHSAHYRLRMGEKSVSIGPVKMTDVGDPPYLELTVVLFELGLPGFIAWLGFKLFIIGALWATYRQLLLSPLKHLALSAMIYVLIIWVNSVMYLTIRSFPHWFFAGFIFLLPRLEYAYTKKCVAKIDEKNLLSPYSLNMD